MNKKYTNITRNFSKTLAGFDDSDCENRLSEIYTARFDTSQTTFQVDSLEMATVVR